MSQYIFKKLKNTSRLSTILDAYLLPNNTARQQDQVQLLDTSFQKIATAKLFGIKQNNAPKRTLTNTQTKAIEIELLLGQVQIEADKEIEKTAYLINSNLSLNNVTTSNLKKYAAFYGKASAKKDPIPLDNRRKIKIIKELKKKKAYWKPEDSEFGLTLQGGGLKGSFGVGAVHFLSNAGILTENKKLSISAASTGSLTSLLLAQKTPEAYEAALEQYWNINNISGMLQIQPDIRAALRKNPGLLHFIKEFIRTSDMGVINGALNVAVEDLKNEITASAWEGFKKGAIVGSFFPNPIIGMAVYGITSALKEGFDAATGKVEELVESVAEIMKQPSFAKLTPVENQLLENGLVNIQRIREGAKTQMRMAVTSYQTSVTAYITENGRLLYPKKVGNNEGYSLEEYHSYEITSINGIGQGGLNTQNEFIIQAALTSGSFPGIFVPKVIRYVDENSIKINEVFYDGGVRENMPFKVLTQKSNNNPVRDINTIIGIYASPINKKLEHIDTIELPTFKDVVAHSLTTIDYEGAINNTFVGKSINWASIQQNGNTHPEILHIAPGIEPVGLTEAVPFYLRASVWYGYLRAYDECFIAEYFEFFEEKDGEVSDPENSEWTVTRTSIRKNTDEIFLLIKMLYKTAAKLAKKSRLNYLGQAVGTTDPMYYVDGFTMDSLKDKGAVIKNIRFDAAYLFTYFRIKNNLLNALANRLDDFNHIRLKSINEAKTTKPP